MLVNWQGKHVVILMIFNILSAVRCVKSPHHHQGEQLFASSEQIKAIKRRKYILYVPGGEARRGEARRGEARRGEERRGEARTGWELRETASGEGERE